MPASVLPVPYLDGLPVTETFQDYDSLLSRLRALIEERSPKLIGIEGYMGTGKSPLARCLAAEMNASVVETDCFSFDLLYPERASSIPRAEPYIDCLDLDVLAAKLADALASPSLVIIEGICLGDVLARIGRQVDLTIYLKVTPLVDPQPWHSYFDLEKYESGSETFMGCTLDQLKYHSLMRPHEKADLMLIRVEGTPWPEGTYVAKR